MSAAAIQNQLTDACLISTVLHIPGLDERWDILFTELHRDWRHGGRLGIIESHKTEFLPICVHLRLTPTSMTAEIRPYGFEQRGLVDLSFSYLIWFETN